MKHEIITCPKWGAVPPREPITWTPGPAGRFIFHHTAGHHPEIENPRDESRQEAIMYARAIQHFHMVENGWIDSGHNFLVCRNGMILQGRWRTVRAIQARRMVVSAHCPGENDQVGIEHEHQGTEPMTAAQREASAWLHAWVCHQYRLRFVPPIFPHRKFFPTSCPGVIERDIPAVHDRATEILRLWPNGTGVA